MKTLRPYLLPALLVAALGLPVAGAAYAMGGPEHCRAAMDGFGGDHLPPPLRGLNLTEAQRDQVFTLLHNQAPQLREKAKAVRTSREELHALSASGSFDEAKARSLAEGAARAEAELAVMRARTESQIFALLTSEQRKQAETLRDEMTSRRGGHGPRGDGPGAWH